MRLRSSLSSLGDLSEESELTGDDPFTGKKKSERFIGNADNPVLVIDSEVELAGIVSCGIKTTEAFEMKNMPRVD